MAEKKLRRPPVLLFKVLYGIGLGPLVGKMILLLTTTGRRSGLPRVTPLQYEEIDGAIYLGSARGLKADWVRNILFNPLVMVQVKGRRFEGVGEVTDEVEAIADFLEYRLKRHPRMVGAILKSEGLNEHPGREELKAYASRLALVIVRKK
jgi:deazaflavin-dependent oxidoreductase (nitroreductase family)